MGLLNKMRGPEQSILAQRQARSFDYQDSSGQTKTVVVGAVQADRIITGPVTAKLSAEDQVARQQASWRQAMVGVEPALFTYTAGIRMNVVITEVKVLSSRLVEVHLGNGEKLVISPTLGPAKSMRLNLAKSLVSYQGAAEVEVRDDSIRFDTTKGTRVIHWEIAGDYGGFPTFTPVRIEHLKHTTKPKAKIMKELNTAALIRKDTVTVKVGFSVKGAEPEGGYTYVTQLKLAEGDTVVCDSKVGFAIGKVLEVHDSVMIDPEADMKLAWIVQKVDTDAWAALQAENKAIDDAVAAHYRTNLQKGYRHRILGEMDPAALALLPAAARD